MKNKIKVVTNISERISHQYGFIIRIMLHDLNFQIDCEKDASSKSQILQNN